MTAATDATTIGAMGSGVSLGDLLRPWHAEWADGSFATVSLAPTPMDRQPSAYVRAAWQDRAYGQVGEAAVSARVAAGHVAIALSWAAPDPRERIADNDVYADACAVLFPLDGREAELETMGDEAHPVTAWHWRAGADRPFMVVARGLGTVERLPEHPLRASAEWRAGTWRVVLARPLDGPGVPLAAGVAVPIGVAIWTGANQERAGLKAHTPVWHRLQLP
ncbi:MAG: hypothetical protein Kow0010_01690 [Dehalococcoidia bacterium]